MPRTSVSPPAFRVRAAALEESHPGRSSPIRVRPAKPVFREPYASWRTRLITKADAIARFIIDWPERGHMRIPVI